MLPITEILDELYRLPEKFEEARTAGRWCAAAKTYEKAVIVSRFIQMDAPERDKLLNRFDEDAVEQAYKNAGWYEEEANADRSWNRKEAV